MYMTKKQDFFDKIIKLTKKRQYAHIFIAFLVNYPTNFLRFTFPYLYVKIKKMTLAFEVIK